MGKQVQAGHVVTTYAMVGGELDDRPEYKRILVKLSGEVAGGNDGIGLDFDVLDRLAAEIASVRELGTEVAIVIGGGNFVRGSELASRGVDRVSADHMGILVTVINGLALQQAMVKRGLVSVVMSAVEVQGICETYGRHHAIEHFRSGKVLILVGGIGNPFFSTDTAAVLRAAELGCQAIFKSTKVDGVYDSDPMKNPNAKRYDTLSFDDAIGKDLEFVDMAALDLARKNKLPLIVFSMLKMGAVRAVLCGRGHKTIVS